MLGKKIFHVNPLWMVNSLVLFWSLLSNSRNSPYLQQFYQPVLKEKITVVTACWILIYLRRHACKVLSKRLPVHNTSTVCGGRQGMIDVCSFPTKGEIKPPMSSQDCNPNHCCVLFLFSRRMLLIVTLMQTSVL